MKHVLGFNFVRKIPAHMIAKLAFPPPQNPKYLSPKMETYMGMEVFLQKEPKIPGPRKIGTAMFGPRIGDRKHLRTFRESETVAANRVTAINPPIDATDPIRKFSIDPGSHTDSQTKQNSLQKGS